MRGDRRANVLVNSRTATDCSICSEARSNVDLAIVGSGASATYTLVHLLPQLPADGPCPNIVVLERELPFEGGVAYGDRSGKSAITITRLHDFLPLDELSRFVRWLKNFRSDEFERLVALGVKGERSADPLDDEKLVNLVGDACVRRAVFGEYLSSIAHEAMDRARAEGRADVQIRRMDVGRISKCRCGLFQLQTAALPDGLDPRASLPLVCARRVLLCLGSPPGHSLPMRTAEVLTRSADAIDPRVVDAPYAKGLDRAMIDAIDAVVAHEIADDVKEVRFVIVGSNASAVESIVEIERQFREYGLRGRITVISGTGKLPEVVPARHVLVERPASEGVGSELGQLIARGGTSASELHDVAERELERAHSAGLHLDQYTGIVNGAIFEALRTMDQDERLQFLQRYANRLGRHQRKMEAAYGAVVEELDSSGVLEVRRGRVLSVSPNGQGIAVEVQENDRRQTSVCDCIVNCTGAAPIGLAPPSSLIARLLDEGLASPHAGTLGFAVDERFAVSPGLFVMGPLLAGNELCGLPVWHMEHCGRIYRFSHDLASILAEEILSDA